MQLYFSGSFGPCERYILENNLPRLVSFAYISIVNEVCQLAKNLNIRHNKLMLDSGAFTAWTQGKQVQINKLADFYDSLINDYSGHFDFVMINLDVIPGKYGVDPTPKEIDQAMIQSMKNYELLNKRFPKQVLPVYHQGEPLSYLKEMMSMTNYICLSPRNDVIEKYRTNWISQFIRYKKYKFHGLATTGKRMMSILPWYSVDSASWLMGGRFGSCMIELNGEKAMPILFSVESQQNKTMDKHFDSLPKPQQKKIEAYIIDKGFTIEKLKTIPAERNLLNIKWFYEQSQKPYKPQKIQQGLFD